MYDVAPVTRRHVLVLDSHENVKHRCLRWIMALLHQADFEGLGSTAYRTHGRVATSSLQCCFDHVAHFFVGLPFLQIRSSTDYIGDISISPDSIHMSIAAANSGVIWLDTRKPSSPVAVLRCPAPVRCCATDGCTVLAALENGQVCSGPLW